jgi:cell division control protein 24
MNLEDAFEVRTIVTKRQSRVPITTSDDALEPQQPNDSTEVAGIKKDNGIFQFPASFEGVAVSRFDFEEDLEASRAYRRAQRDTMDFSFRSSIAHTNAWSVFSTLSDVSIISAIALPLYPEEIGNAQHYQLGEIPGIPAIGPKLYTTPDVKPLYQQFLEVELRLAQIPGFPEILVMLKEESEKDNPLSFLIQVFRRGMPLLMLLERVPGIRNLNNLAQLEDDIDAQKMPKAATYIFMKTCIDDLGFRPEECFFLSDLFGDDSTGFIKVRTSIAVCIGIHASDVITRSSKSLRGSSICLPAVERYNP